ncbi:MAG: hypothetical protein KJ995_01275 [Candidatus Omnitrophica bacterium]|nr:hypothetical protein [Candidatus Omnitrophota bacterium]MBU1128271.1 hypothetical protein [Candidatus Omnitrophota bacterium]MBU1656965.1 hypothetical protein [Candidatus Omnitrophota bacterium]MBU1784027.1 hypothetical protein [Candidatus Omnitrophota bacterium]MBU1851021.1 hypothetical protein [Candidatus Omnitrophota bacterium]
MATGPYAIVRHPVYLAELIMFVFVLLALGPYRAIAVNKTRYRLIPGIW